MKKMLVFLTAILVAVLTFFLLGNPARFSENNFLSSDNPKLTVFPTPVLPPISSQKTLQNDYHIFQTFNNCGPAALSMTFSYYQINKTQHELGHELRPYQNPQGNNDDKSVTLEELAEKSKEYGFVPIHRPAGDIDIVKQFIANDMPVITRTWLSEDEDIGHYRIIKGYNEKTKEIIQDDSLQGKNLRYSYEDFNVLWKKFNYEYLVLVPKEKQNIADIILGENKDAKNAWTKAIKNAEEELKKNPEDIYSRFNLSVAHYYTGKYQKSVKEFEKVENNLPFRTLWYQTEPILAYYELGDYERVFSITDKIFNNHNLAFSELYLLRGQIYQKQGNSQKAKEEFEKAVYYNSNFFSKIPEI